MGITCSAVTLLRSVVHQTARARRPAQPFLSGVVASVTGMFDHVGVPVADVEKSLAFYLGVFGPIGMREVKRFPVPPSIVVGLGLGGEPGFWLSPSRGPETRELHIAFTAPDRAAVDAVHRAAVEAGAQVLHPPRIWP